VTSPSPSSPSPSSPSPTVEAPLRPTLDRVVRTAEDKHASDKRATLTIGKVSPVFGTVKRIVVRYAAGGAVGTKDVTPNGQATDYEVTVEGLTNGTEYTFTAEVCNSGDKCTTSDPLKFAPYGVPRVVAPKLTLGAAQKITVTVEPVVRRGNPGTTTCTLTVTSTPTDPTAPATQPVKSDGDTVTFTGKPGSAYTAAETCTTSDVVDGTAKSEPLLVPAAV
jgi:hypothetical protein